MAAQEAKTEEAQKPVVEKQTNCLGCGKPIKKIRKYYRNGKFFCTKKCYVKMLEKAKEEKK
jgi:hypothetical protein